MTRRPPSIQLDDVAGRVWRLRLKDGTVRGSLAPENVRELVESGVASTDCQIARMGREETWERLGHHPVWRSIAPTKVKLNFAVEAAPDPGIVRDETRQATMKMAETWRGLRRKEQGELGIRTGREEMGRFLQALGFASAVAGLVCLGDIIVFTCELVTAFILLLALVRVCALVLVWRILR